MISLQMNDRLGQLCQGALFTALTAVCSQLVVNIGVIPISLSLLAVFLCGGLLRPRTALLSQLAYLLLGLVGVPVFTNFGAGPAKLLGPTGGYLFTYPLMVLLVALAVRRFGARWWVLAAAMLLAMLVCYTGGTAWFCFQAKLGVADALSKAVLPFLPFDALKIALACVVSTLIRRRMPR